MSITLPIHDSLVHPRTGEPLEAVGLRRNGDPIWPIIGGDGSEDDINDDEPDDKPDEVEDDTADTTGDGDDTTGDDDPADDDKPLGPKGEKALQAEKEKRRAADARRRTAEKEAAAAKAELEKLRKGATPKAKDGDEGDDKVDPDEIRESAERAAQEKANQRILRAEVRAIASEHLADPKDALAFLDLEDFTVSEDGEVDSDEVADAIAALLEKKPYLAKAAQGGDKKPKFKGSGDGGAKPKKPSRPNGLHEAVQRHFAK